MHGHGHARRTLCKLRVALNLTAVNGIISVADPGDFGPATIQHSVTTDGENMGSVGFGTLAVGIFVAGSSPKNVVLRNLTFDGQGSGNYSILLQGPANLTVDQCKIEGFLTTGIEIDSTGAENVLVTNTLVDGANVGQNGFGVFKGIAPDVVALDHVTIKGTTAAAVLNQSGLLQLTNCVVTQSDIGVQADTASAISVANTAITANSVGVCVYDRSKIRLDTNDIYDSGQPSGIAAGPSRRAAPTEPAGRFSYPHLTYRVPCCSDLHVRIEDEEAGAGSILTGRKSARERGNRAALDIQATLTDSVGYSARPASTTCEA